MEKTNKYDLLLQNNASKQHFVFSGLTDLSLNHLYHQFEVDIEVPDGEYTYASFINNRDDVEYELKTPLLDTILHTEEGDVVLRDIQPGTGLLQMGATTDQVNVYDESEDKNTIFYYDN